MKKGLLLFLLVLIVLPVVSGALTLEGPTHDTYNLGEVLDLKGFLLRDQLTLGLLKLDLNCGGSKFPLFAKTVNLAASEQYSFEENVILSTTLSGLCTVQASLEISGSVVEQINSKKFTLTKELIGSFSIENKKIQKGGTIEITGTVKKHNGQNIDGLATLYFNKEGVTVITETLRIVDGKLEYIKNAITNPSGNYSLTIEVNDIYGNKKTFDNILSFSITDELVVDLETNSLELMPGKVFTINAKVTDSSGQRVSYGRTLLSLAGQEYTEEITRGGFEYKIDLPKDIKSGEHTVKLIIFDDFGNILNKDLKLMILPRVTSLNIELEKKSFNPSEKILILPVIIDQAGDFIQEKLNMMITDSGGRKLFSGEVDSNKNFDFDLEFDSLPGKWTILLNLNGLKKEKTIEILDVKKLDFSFKDGILSMKNIGNVDYIDIVEIGVKTLNQESTISEKVNIDVGETYTFNLGTEVPSGVYNIQVGDKQFNNEYIEGNTKSILFYYSYWIFIFLFVIFIIYLFLLRKKRRKVSWTAGKLYSKQHTKSPFKNVIISRKSQKQENIIGKKNYISEFRNLLLKKNEEKHKKVVKNLSFNFKPTKIFKKSNDYIEIKPDEERLRKFREKSSYLSKAYKRENRREDNNPSEKKDLFKMFD